MITRNLLTLLFCAMACLTVQSQELTEFVPATAANAGDVNANFDAVV